MPNLRDRSNEAATDVAGGRRIRRIAATIRPARRAIARALARLPRPARLLWIVLAILGFCAAVLNLGGVGLTSLAILPAVAALTDIAYQRFRFHSIRAPDAALATGVLLALILPPTVDIIQASAVVLAATALRHVLRYRERPLLNPASAGVLIGALAFGMAPAWWGSIDVRLVVLFGLLVTLRTPGSWRLPASFLFSYALLSPLGHLLLGEATSPQVLLLGAIDPSIMFFGFFMVAEPRTSLPESADRLFFGFYIGGITNILPAVIPTLAPIAALLLGNITAVLIRQMRLIGASNSLIAQTKSPHRRRKRREPLAEDSPGDWGIRRRIVAGLMVFAVLGLMGVVSHGSSAMPVTGLQPPAPPPVFKANGCTSDNTGISSDVLTLLHGKLGPSVILSYVPNTGTVVFYDPVNKATVTETDLYEDFGYAEFNGDDYTTMGCS